jgi:hypothetical protein
MVAEICPAGQSAVMLLKHILLSDLRYDSQSGRIQMKEMATASAVHMRSRCRPKGDRKSDALHSVRVVMALGAWVSLSSLAHATGPSTNPDSVSNASSPAPETAMCSRTDKVVFSCSLVGHNKVVSLCASGDVLHGTGHFYYAFGRPGVPELRYPAADQNIAGPFTHTHLTFAGGTGGYAYSFMNGEIKYILYSVSGAGFQYGGVLVQRAGSLRAMADMKCETDRITETDDNDLTDVTLKWKRDDDIAQHGLPHIDRAPGAENGP